MRLAQDMPAKQGETRLRQAFRAEAEIVTEISSRLFVAPPQLLLPEYPKEEEKGVKLMKWFAALSIVSAGVLAACDQDPEVNPAEVASPINDPADIEPEAVTADPPAGTTAGLDLDNDRDIDKAEWTGVRDDGLAGWNDDEDVRITKAEFTSAWGERGLQGPEQAFQMLDDDNNGFIGEDEFFDDAEFAELDENNNDVLEDAEWDY